MIRLDGGTFADLLPESLSGQPEIRALAYAVGRQVKKLCAYADGTRIYAAVASMPERVLDLMAIELRTPAYNEQFSIDVKRMLVESSLTFYARMGTPAACNQIIATIFKVGYIEEWYSYDGAPHHFRAYVGSDGGPVDPGSLEEFRRVLGSVKRLSSWLDDVITIATLDPDLLTAVGRMGRGYMDTELPEAAADYHMDHIPAYAGGVFGTITATAIPAAE